MVDYWGTEAVGLLLLAVGDGADFQEFLAEEKKKLPHLDHNADQSDRDAHDENTKGEGREGLKNLLVEDCGGIGAAAEYLIADWPDADDWLRVQVAQRTGKADPVAKPKESVQQNPNADHMPAIATNHEKPVWENIATGMGVASPPPKVNRWPTTARRPL